MVSAAVSARLSATGWTKTLHPKASSQVLGNQIVPYTTSILTVLDSHGAGKKIGC
jgi:hypothetical protein